MSQLLLLLYLFSSRLEFQCYVTFSDAEPTPQRTKEPEPKKVLGEITNQKATFEPVILEAYQPIVVKQPIVWSHAITNNNIDNSVTLIRPVTELRQLELPPEGIISAVISQPEGKTIDKFSLKFNFVENGIETSPDYSKEYYQDYNYKTPSPEPENYDSPLDEYNSSANYDYNEPAMPKIELTPISTLVKVNKISTKGLTVRL